MGGPWNFNNVLLVLEVPTGYGDFSEMQFRWADFWIQVHNVPLVCMSKNIRLLLGQSISRVKDIDVGASGDCFGKFLHLIVSIDTSKPLKRVLRVKLDGMEMKKTLLLKAWMRASSPGNVRPLGYSSRNPGISTIDSNKRQKLVKGSLASKNTAAPNSVLAVGTMVSIGQITYYGVNLKVIKMVDFVVEDSLICLNSDGPQFEPRPDEIVGAKLNPNGHIKLLATGSLSGPGLDNGSVAVSISSKDNMG
ncbi:hypothetical protein JRO89_XS11G0122900 [Xanthoceras sorbifolium]|uniref:DUF4283 domain-containing protein n=1 Tax=Xanthoceras sorbifolium TaxID=99658 RepID=A0ABQ8HFD0_9ROSI|nr:hypothetical protein JRO89_XS11G0122900 [Xanthoceras sorbifolium]